MSTHTTSYKELLAQREALEQQITAARKAEVTDAVQKIRGLVEAFGLTPEDVSRLPSKSARLAWSPPNIETLRQGKPGLAGVSRLFGSRTRIVLSLRSSIEK